MPVGVSATDSDTTVSQNKQSVNSSISEMRKMIPNIDSDKKRSDDLSRITRLQLPVIPVNIVSLDTTVSQNKQSVNSSISEKAENDTENREFSVSEEQKTDYGEVMDELLQKYESGEIDRDAYNDFVGCSGGNYSNIFTLKGANI